MDVVCPGFVADCLETLEEIGIEGKRDVPRAGGREFHAIPCLNEHPAWIAALVDLVLANLQGWLAPPPDAPARELTMLRAKALGASNELAPVGTQSPRRLIRQGVGGVPRPPAVENAAGTAPLCKGHSWPDATNMQDRTHRTSPADAKAAATARDAVPVAGATAHARRRRRRRPRARHARAAAEGRGRSRRAASDAWLRARADIENVRKQAAADVAQGAQVRDRALRRRPAAGEGFAESALAARTRRPSSCAPASSSR